MRGVKIKIAIISLLCLALGAVGGWVLTTRHYKPLLTDSTKKNIEYKSSINYFNNTVIDLTAKYNSATSELADAKNSSFTMYDLPTPPATPSGTLCRDGWVSPSAPGRGVCSGHWGIAH